MKMKFKNRPNPFHKIGDQIIWESRSTAVNLVVLMVRNFYSDPYVVIHIPRCDNMGR